jgi:hypothetical protein
MSGHSRVQEDPPFWGPSWSSHVPGDSQLSVVRFASPDLSRMTLGAHSNPGDPIQREPLVAHCRLGLETCRQQRDGPKESVAKCECKSPRAYLPS